MDEAFRIYVDRLQSGSEEAIHEELPPSFLEVDEPELAFSAPVKVAGRAYLADDELVLHLTVTTEATLPCAVCNSPAQVPIAIEETIEAVPLAEISTGVFSLAPLLREMILLEVPPFAECGDGACPNREELKPYLRKSAGEANDTFHPFADLAIDEEEE